MPIIDKNKRTPDSFYAPLTVDTSFIFSENL